MWEGNWKRRVVARSRGWCVDEGLEVRETGEEGSSIVQPGRLVGGGKEKWLALDLV